MFFRFQSQQLLEEVTFETFNDINKNESYVLITPCMAIICSSLFPKNRFMKVPNFAGPYFFFSLQ